MTSEDLFEAWAETQSNESHTLAEVMATTTLTKKQRSSLLTFALQQGRKQGMIVSK